MAAFEQYWALGPDRSLRKLAGGDSSKLRQYQAWSARYQWQERVLTRQQEEIAAGRAAARKEAAALARRRLRNAQIQQEGALTIIAKSKLMELTVEEARRLLPVARAMLAAGMAQERQEMIDVFPHHVYLMPDKPLAEMSDGELFEFIAYLDALI